MRRRSSRSSRLVRLSGPILRRTALMLVSVPPIFFGSIGVVGVAGEVLLDFVERYCAAQLDQAA